jgi:polyisoprenyl-teichoic acid--peptidoglycan teichoic acid transferase
MSSGDTPTRRRLVDSFDYGAPTSEPDASSRSGAPIGDRPGGRGGGRAGGPPGGDSGGDLTGGPQRPSRRRRFWLTGGGIAVVLVVALVAVGLVTVNNKFDLVDRLGVGVDAAESGGARNYLVIGSDSRDGIDEGADGADVFVGDSSPGGQRADAIMIMRVDPDAGQIDVVSVPRDLWVPIAGTGEDERINTAYAGGAQQIIDTIRNDFGIPINHYIEVDFAGFQALVDSVGGVPMWFDTPMRDLNSGLDVDDGCVTLDGFQALAFVRSRYLEVLDDGGWESDPTGDGGRISRQQVFMRRVMAAVAENVSFTDIGGLNDLADVAVEHVTIDQNLNVRRAISLGRQFMGMPDGAIRFHALPTVRWFTQGGADVQLLDPEGATPLLDMLRGEPLSDVPSPLVQVSVLNGTGVQNQAVKTGEQLKAIGFQVLETARADRTYAVTTVRYGTGAARGAVKVAAHLGGTVELEADDELLPGQVVVITGGTFTSVLEAAKPGAPTLPPSSTTSTTRVPSGAASTAGPSSSSSTSSSTDGSAGSGDASASIDDADDDAGTVGLAPGEPPEGVRCS